MERTLSGGVFRIRGGAQSKKGMVMRFSPQANANRYSRLGPLIAGGGVLVAVVMASPIVAQTSSSAAETAPADLQMQGDFIVAQTPGHVLANNLIGADVVSADGDTIGPVADIIIDQNRRLVGITVSVGGLLGIRDREIGIPVSAMAIGRDVEETGSVGARGASFNDPVSDVILTLNSAAIEQAPKFARLEDIPGLGSGTAVSPDGTPSEEPQSN